MSLSGFSAISAELIRQRKFLRRGLQLSLIVAGEQGTGKATFINALCDTEVVPVGRPPPEVGLGIENYTTTIVEVGTRVNLDIALTSGFGDAVDNSHSTAKVVQHLEKQMDAFLQEECRIKRSPQFKDTRVHAALYFIRPTGKGLRAIDIQCLKALGKRCNVIPVLAKGDLLTSEERQLNKTLVLKDIRDYGINIYDFATCFDEMDDELPGLNVKGLVPFSIVASTDTEEIDGVQCKVRHLPFGTVRIDDPEHSDFLLLRTCLLGACLQDLKDTTHSVYYERYRTMKLSQKV